MKILGKTIAMGLLLFSSAYAQNQDPLPYWKDVSVVGVNKEAPRTTFMSYPNEKLAMEALQNAPIDYTKSPYFKLLNGTWKFYFVDQYKDLPANITQPGAKIDWQEIKVPGNWELQGHGEAFYVNQPYEFATYNPTPPLLPEENPVGVYMKQFEIPKDWKDRDVYLHLAGAKSGVYVYINGKEVGYSENSKDPAEFLINDYLKNGENTLILEIYRWSTGSWLECQDFLRVSGIERDVFLWSQPKLAINDFRVVSSLDDNYQNGIFKLNVDLTNHTGNSEKVQIGYKLYDPQGNVISSGSKPLSVAIDAKGHVEFNATLTDVEKWTAETPNLYKLLMSVEKRGKITEVVPFNIGFRRIEIKKSDIIVNEKPLHLFLVNGQPIKLKGTNIHETTEDGHYLTPEKLRRNFEIMKLNNINSVRLSHYPQDRKFYEMCDVYGIYVYDEANIESHGMYYTIHQDDMRKGTVGHEDQGKRGTLGHNPDYLDSHMSRIKSMFERNKNYPSVTIWSMGNEAGNGYNFYNAYTWLKEADKDLMARPVAYERALEEWNTDMIVPQYPGTQSFEYYGKKGRYNQSTNNRPYVPSEYSHAMGNSSGNLWDQWQQIYKYPNLQGGYLWEWIDHAVNFQDKDGRLIWAYGGDFGENQPSDGNFVADGIVNPDQTPHPAMAEVKYTHQNVGFEDVDQANGKIKIKNRFYFTNLDKYNVGYTILEDGVPVKKQKLDLSLAPQDSIVIDVEKIDMKPEHEYLINFEVATIESEPLVPAGHVIAYDQFQLQPRLAQKDFVDNTADKLSVETKGDEVIISSKKVYFAFNKSTGVVTSYKVDGHEYFKDSFGVQPNFWRGPTDNDYGSGAPKRLQIWKQSSKDFKVYNVKTNIKNNVATLDATYALAAGNDYIMEYVIYPSGIVHIGAIFTNSEAQEGESILTAEALEATESDSQKRDLQRQKTAKLDVPRIGVRFRLPSNMENVKYYGRGPEENYLDRNKGTIVGIYNSTASDLYFPYVRPQENGHHTDTRWVALSSDNGNGLLVKADETIGFNALRNSIEDFDSEESDAPYQWRNMSPKEVANHNEEAAKNSLRKQTHAADITPRDFVEVCVDMKQYGVAGYNSWGARPEPKYSIQANKQYEWGFTLIPFADEAQIQKSVLKKY